MESAKYSRKRIEENVEDLIVDTMKAYRGRRGMEPFIQNI
jgi:hypothetical protein